MSTVWTEDSARTTLRAGGSACTGAAGTDADVAVEDADAGVDVAAAAGPDGAAAAGLPSEPIKLATKSSTSARSTDAPPGDADEVAVVCRRGRTRARIRGRSVASPDSRAQPDGVPVRTSTVF